MVTVRTRYILPVMFTCEAKGGPVSTGHRMRIDEFAALRGPRSFRCGACGEVHTWTTATAWIGESRSDGAAWAAEARIEASGLDPTHAD